MTHAFDALVVEVNVRHLDFRRECVGFHRKAVIVRSDFHVAIDKILYWLIAAAMTKPQLESLAAKRAPQELMAKTNTKSGRARLRDLLHLFNFFRHGCGIA